MSAKSTSVGLQNTDTPHMTYTLSRRDILACSIMSAKSTSVGLQNTDTQHDLYIEPQGHLGLLNHVGQINICRPINTDKQHDLYIEPQGHLGLFYHVSQINICWPTKYRHTTHDLYMSRRAILACSTMLAEESTSAKYRLTTRFIHLSHNRFK